jgi:hypothetical protein
MVAYDSLWSITSNMTDVLKQSDGLDPCLVCKSESGKSMCLDRLMSKVVGRPLDPEADSALLAEMDYATTLESTDTTYVFECQAQGGCERNVLATTEGGILVPESDSGTCLFKNIGSTAL